MIAVIGGTLTIGGLIASAAIKAAIWTPFVVATMVSSAALSVVFGSLGFLAGKATGNKGMATEWANSAAKVGEYVIAFPAVLVVRLSVAFRWVPIALAAVGTALLTSGTTTSSKTNSPYFKQYILIGTCAFECWRDSCSYWNDDSYHPHFHRNDLYIGRGVWDYSLVDKQKDNKKNDQILNYKIAAGIGYSADLDGRFQRSYYRKSPLLTPEQITSLLNRGIIKPVETQVPIPGQTQTPIGFDENAAQVYQKAIGDDRAAQVELGKWFSGLEGNQSVGRNNQLALYWFDRAAGGDGEQAGVARSELVALLLGEGKRELQQEYLPKALLHCKKAAHEGNKQASEDLRKLRVLAIKWGIIEPLLSEGAASGDLKIPDAESATPQQKAQWAQLYCKAIEEQGNEAARLLAQPYDSACPDVPGITKNDATAVEWYKLAASRRDAISCCYLAIMLSGHKNRVSKDLPQAILYCERALAGQQKGWDGIKLHPLLDRLREEQRGSQVQSNLSSYTEPSAPSFDEPPPPYSDEPLT